MIDLTHKGIRRLLYALLDEISDTARATYRGRISARLLDRTLALRMGLPVWHCQRVAKAWKLERRTVVRLADASGSVGFRRSGGTNSPYGVRS
jgi:hypothetical protein